MCPSVFIYDKIVPDYLIFIQTKDKKRNIHQTISSDQ